MKAYDLLELSGRNLREAVLRNSLTTIGIGVGIASLVALFSLSIGLQRLFTRQLGRSGLFNAIYVTSRTNFRGAGEARAPRNVSNTPPKPLDDAARDSFAKIANVVEVYPNFAALGEFRMTGAQASDDPHFGGMTGLPPSARNSEVFDDVQGRFFSAQNAAEVVILSDFGRELLKLPRNFRNIDDPLTKEQADQLLGKEIVLRYAQRQATDKTPNGSDGQVMDSGPGFSIVAKEQPLKIVGIVTQQPYRGLGGGRAEVLLPVDFAESLEIVQPADVRNIMRQGQGKTYVGLMVRVGKSEQVKQVEDEIKNQGFTAFSILDASQGLQRAFLFLDLFLAIFGSLALVVASLGIVNTLVMAILERRREIGIMKAIGASDADVKLIFFVEAGSMGLMGGALGVLLGWMIGRIINFGTNLYLQRQNFPPENFWVIPVWLIGLAVGFSIVVSLFAALYPASRAAKLDPVQALRHD